MTRTICCAVLAMATTLSAVPLAITSADAQVPPKAGPYGDRDRDGVPNAYDNYNNRGQNMGDRDHDGVPNRYDQYNNNRSYPQQAQRPRDSDHDGVPNRYDQFNNNLLRDKDHDGMPNALDQHDRNPNRY